MRHRVSAAPHFHTRGHRSFVVGNRFSLTAYNVDRVFLTIKASVIPIPKMPLTSWGVLNLQGALLWVHDPTGLRPLSAARKHKFKKNPDDRCKCLETTHRETARTVAAVAREDTCAGEVQGIPTRRIAERGRPVEPEAGNVVHASGGVFAPARSREENKHSLLSCGTGFPPHRISIPECQKYISNKHATQNRNRTISGIARNTLEI